MRVLSFLAVLAIVPSVASAGFNRNYMVPAYSPCTGVAENCSPKLASAYTFDSIVLQSSAERYGGGPNKVALIVVVKGVKDPSGAPFTGRLTLSTGLNRVTILQVGIGTFRDNSALAAQPPYVIEVKNGSGHLRYKTPDSTPSEGLVVNSLTAPIVYDPDGNPLASTGTQTKH